jgi:hypothetical protein
MTCISSQLQFSIPGCLTSGFLTMAADPQQAYALEKERLDEKLKQLTAKRNRLGWLRLAAVVIIALIAYQVFVHAGVYGWLIIIGGLTVFLVIVSTDINNNKEILNTGLLIKINEHELDILKNEYSSFYDGIRYKDDHHPYATDLDIFGRSSLFQYVNRNYTEQGRNLLAHNLLHGLEVNAIVDRQEAIKELSPMLQWRQQMQSLSMQQPVSVKTQSKIEDWLAREGKHFTHPVWKPVITVYSILMISATLLAIFDIFAIQYYFPLFVACYVITSAISKNAIKAYVDLTGISKEISTVEQLLKWIETKQFSSSLLKQLQLNARSSGQQAAHVETTQLKKILNRFDVQLNLFVFIFLNTLLFWSVRQMISLNKWKTDNKGRIGDWFQLIAEAEVLNSLATLHFNQPSWAFPEFIDQHFTFKGVHIGHPLLPSKERVDSSFTLSGEGKVALVTGSNMAGKSTFLRSVGVNIVLARIGASICAHQLILSPVTLMTSMRVADNLAESTSTFYAELKKLKCIIDAVNAHEQVFILLDEILRGTNSLDRHAGSEALVTQLIRHKAIAIVATHDLELAALQKLYPSSIENYHFDVQVEGQELYFDYKLKEGVCTSLNASILMSKIGIELGN